MQEQLEEAIGHLAEACRFVRQKGFVPLYKAEVFILAQGYPFRLTCQATAYGDVWRVRLDIDPLEVGEHAVEWGQLG